MKIVLISKSYYPSQSARALRTTELAQQFAKMGHTVIVYSVVSPNQYDDYTRETGVIVKSIKTRLIPTSQQSKFHRKAISALSVLFGELAEFPNIELRYLVPKILSVEKDIDLLITIATPYPIHWGAAYAKRSNFSSFPAVWVSDCGDPYMGNSVHKHPSYFTFIERFWGKMTDYITVPIAGAIPAYLPEVHNKIRVIPQGLDFSSIRIDDNFTGNQIPKFAYTGTIFPGYRDLTSFLEYLCTVDKDFCFYVFTKTPGTLTPYKDKLKGRLVISDYIPRTRLIYEFSKMDFLVNLTNRSSVQSPSKLIDYGLAKRPVLDLSTPFIEFETFMAFMRRDYSRSHIIQDIDQYNITNIARRFLDLYDEKTKSRQS